MTDGAIWDVWERAEGAEKKQLAREDDGGAPVCEALDQELDASGKGFENFVLSKLQAE